MVSAEPPRVQLQQVDARHWEDIGPELPVERQICKISSSRTSRVYSPRCNYPSYFTDLRRSVVLCHIGMAKGSQLSQLKSALSQAGLTQHSQNGKKRKRSSSTLESKEHERRAAKLKEIQQKMNPFDVKVTKVKHDVGGRKIAGMVGRPAQSKQAGIEQVSDTVDAS